MTLERMKRGKEHETIALKPSPYKIMAVYPPNKISALMIQEPPSINLRYASEGGCSSTYLREYGMIFTFLMFVVFMITSNM